MLEKRYYQGNLFKNNQESLRNVQGKGWLIGNFDKFIEEDPRKTDVLELKYWKFLKGNNFAHSTKTHCSVTELTIVFAGEIKGFVGDDIITLKGGDFILIHPKTVNNLVKEVVRSADGITIKVPSDSKDIIKIKQC